MKFYADTLHMLAGYGASIVRLDAFAYAHKAVGERNFLNEPGTWSLLARLQTIADADGVTLLPEIHASYGEKSESWPPKAMPSMISFCRG